MFSILPNTLNPNPGLRNVVYKHFLKSAVVPLCSLIGLMLLLYFGGTYYTYQDSLSEMRERAKLTVSEIARSEANSLNQKLAEVSRNTAYLQTVTERLFQYNYDSRMDHDQVRLEHADSGFKFRDLNTLMDGATIYGSSLPSSLFVSPETELTESLVRRLHVTEALDLHFQRTVDSNSNIHSVYFSSWDKSNRTYPPIINMPNSYRSGRHAAFFREYHLANATNNPARNVVWTAAHFDEQEDSWMLSSIAPVYRYGFLEGVIGVNIMLSNFTASLTTTPLIWDSSPILTDKNGTLLDLSAGAKELLSVSVIPKNSLKVKILSAAKENKLFQHAVFKDNAVDVEGFEEGLELASCCVQVKNEEYLLSQQGVNETGWRLVMLTPMSKVTEQVAQYQGFINNLGFYFVLLTGLFFALFFVYLKNQASSLANRVTKPIEMVVDFISRLNRLGNNKSLPAMQVGIRELDCLIDSSTEIQIARSRLSILNEELEKKNEQLQTLAITDRLTGLYNRHKLDEILVNMMEEARRYGKHFSLAILDIDHFKQINDTYGHQLGDEVLIDVANILQQRIRKTDVVGRWGGEEFLIVLPNSSLKQAAIVLDELRAQISHSNFAPLQSLTISLGLANSDKHPCEDSILAAADEALYRAKSNGRNRLETESGHTKNGQKVESEIAEAL